MFSCYFLTYSHITLSWMNSQQKYFQWLLTSREKRTRNNTVPYTENGIILYYEIKPTSIFFFQEEKAQFIHFKLSSETIALFWSHKQLRHYICSLEILLWGSEGYFFAISDKPGLCASLIMPTPFIHPTHVWPSHISGLVPV